MAANTAPIYTLTPDIAWTTAITAANTAMDGTGTVSTVFTAGVNGSYVKKLFARAAGNCTGSVLRVFINNGNTNATAANNVLYTEVTLPATTASATSALQTVEIPLEFALPYNSGSSVGYKINVTLGTAVSAGWVVGVIGGDY